MDFSELKQAPFQSQYPNGRVPAIDDPNTGMKLWESGAIIEYLLETYDPTNTLSYSSGAERYEQKCWMHFQMSGQVSYYPPAITQPSSNLPYLGPLLRTESVVCTLYLQGVDFDSMESH